MRVIFYTGKGGTGKSVISCATGLRAAKLGYKALVLSADPAHTLSDIFERRVVDEPTQVAGSLWAIQVDPIKEVRDKYGVIQDYVASVFHSRGLDEALAYEIASLPNMTSFLSLLKILDFSSSDFDALILDTVPSGEALKNLYLPMLLSDVSRKFLRTFGSLLGVLTKVFSPAVKVPPPSGEVIDADLALIDRLEAVRGVITDQKTTSLRLVANPDLFSIENLRRTYMTASLYNINVDLVVVNKVIPDEVSDQYFHLWKQNQSKYLMEVERAFCPLPVRKVKLFNQELKGLEMLEAMADQLFGDEDPLDVLYEGKPLRVSVDADKGEVALTIKTPFARRELLEVERLGDELVIAVDTEVGEIRSFIPLPAIVYPMKLTKAKLVKGELRVFFTRV